MGGKIRKSTTDSVLVRRITEALSHRVDVESKKMFGGVAFMVCGHMAVGVNGKELMVRVGKQSMSDSLAMPFVRPMDFTGVPLAGFVYVGPEAVQTNLGLVTWLQRALLFVETLPAK